MIDNLRLTQEHILLIPYNIEYKLHDFERVVQARYKDLKIKFFCLEEQTRGAAETLLVALEDLQKENSPLGEILRDPEEHLPVASVDSDSFYCSDILGQWDGTNGVVSFLDFRPQAIFSYVTVKGDPERRGNTAETGGWDSNLQIDPNLK